MKKTGIKALCIFLIFVMTAFSGTAFFAAKATPTDSSQYNPTSSSSAYGIDANSALLGVDKQIENVRAAFLYEANSRTLMYAWNADAAMYPASLVKIMTALQLRKDILTIL